MFDDRWPEEAEELAAALAAILTKECTPETPREAESADGNIERLDSTLSDFGLWDLPADPYLFVRAAIELGNHVAPVPFVSAPHSHCCAMPSSTPPSASNSASRTAHSRRWPIPLPTRPPLLTRPICSSATPLI